MENTGNLEYKIFVTQPYVKKEYLFISQGFSFEPTNTPQSFLIGNIKFTVSRSLFNDIIVVRTTDVSEDTVHIENNLACICPQCKYPYPFYKNSTLTVKMDDKGNFLFENLQGSRETNVSCKKCRITIDIDLDLKEMKWRSNETLYEIAAKTPSLIYSFGSSWFWNSSKDDQNPSTKAALH
jgi:hypothetical protein